MRRNASRGSELYCIPTPGIGTIPGLSTWWRDVRSRLGAYQATP